MLEKYLVAWLFEITPRPACGASWPASVSGMRCYRLEKTGKKCRMQLKGRQQF
jgi:hypothetical protein